MITTAIFNAILAIGVIVMVVTPLVWAILTQHHDHPRPAATEPSHSRAAQAASYRSPAVRAGHGTRLIPDDRALAADAARAPTPAARPRLLPTRRNSPQARTPP